MAAEKANFGVTVMAPGAIYHSDRGAQYTSKMFSEWAQAHDVRLSTGRTGSFHDNAVAESFFATLKNECYHRKSWGTRQKAKLGGIDYFEAYYNRSRPHSSIDYRIPAEMMEGFMRRCDIAFAEPVEEVMAAA